jgi:hypothetical protein
MHVKGLKHPATVIAALALFVALGGGAALASGLISGSQLKNHSIPAKKLTKKAIASLHGQRGPRGATGATGAAGVTGATGAQGPQGPAGPSNTLTWKATVATAGASFAAANTVTLATVTPFTIKGYCYLSSGTTYAETYITTATNGSSLNDYDASDYYSYNFNASTGPVMVGYSTSDGGTHSPDFYGPNDGSFAAQNPTGTTVIDGFPNEGTYVQGGSGPACSFSGYLVKP